MVCRPPGGGCQLSWAGEGGSEFLALEEGPKNSSEGSDGKREKLEPPDYITSSHRDTDGLPENTSFIGM